MIELIARCIFTFTLGVLGSMLFTKLHIASGAMLGAMAAVGLANLLDLPVWFHEDWKVIIQICSGAIIGLKTQAITLQSLKDMRRPLFIMFTGVFLYNIVFGILVCQLCHLDISTAMFSVAPGGTADITIIAPDFGADPVIISITVRFIRTNFL